MSVEEIERATRALGQDEFARIAASVHALEQETTGSAPTARRRLNQPA